MAALAESWENARRIGQFVDAIAALEDGSVALTELIAWGRRVAEESDPLAAGAAGLHERIFGEPIHARHDEAREFEASVGWSMNRASSSTAYQRTCRKSTGHVKSGCFG